MREAVTAHGVCLLLFELGFASSFGQVFSDIRRYRMGNALDAQQLVEARAADIFN